LLTLWAAAVSGAHAQSLRQVVREHVADELEPKPEPEPPKAEPKSEPPKAEPKPAAAAAPAATASAPDSAARPGDGEGFVLSTEGPAYKGPNLPQRVFGRQFQIDLKLGAGYRGWVPQQYPSVAVDAGSYYVWTVDVRARIFRWLILRRGYYESNSLAGPRTNEAAVAAQVGDYIPKVAWVLGVLGFPLSDAWEPIIRYESVAFHTAAHPSEPVCVVTESVAGDLSKCMRSKSTLSMTSGFETFVLAMRYDYSKDHSAVIAPPGGKIPPVTFGIGLMQYRKPYQVTVGQNTLKDYLFDGRFRGAGLALGTEVGGGPYRLAIDANAQLGLGEVSLTKQVTLNALAPEDWLIGYVQGNVTVSYNLPITTGAPTLMFVPSATGGGASFFFFKAAQQKSGQPSDATTLNWDFLWSVHASLVLSL
jgi:hypothetical protein